MLECFVLEGMNAGFKWLTASVLEKINSSYELLEGLNA